MKKIVQYIILLLASINIYADDLFFNPAFFKDHGEDIDLSAYEKLMQPTGMYGVKMYLNDIFIKEKNVNFLRASGYNNITGDNQGLYPCISPEFFYDYLVSNIDGNGDECVNLSDIHQSIVVKYNFFESKLYIYIPQALLKNKSILINRENWSNGITAALINYDLTNSVNFNKSYQNFLGIESGLNIGALRFRTNSSIILDQSNGNTYKQINNYNNYVETTLPNIRSNLVFGDNNTSNIVFESLNFQGIKLSSANEMLVNSQQGFAPDITGVAKTEATIIIKQNGNTIYRTNVPAGPFRINDLNSIGASGDLEVLVEEADGSTQIQRIPFSVLPILKRSKHFDYEFAAGRFHSNNTNQNDMYFTQGNIFYGVNSLLTLYGGLQFASKYKSINVGFGSNLGSYGAFSSDITYANSIISDVKRNNGLSLRFLYSKNLNNYGTSINLMGYRYSNKNFYTFKDTTYKNTSGYEYNYAVDENGNNVIETPISYYNINHNSKSNFQFTFSQSLNGFGSISVSNNSHTYWNTSKKTQSRTLSYNKNMKGFSLNGMYNESKTFGIDQVQKYISLGLSIPLSRVKANKFIDSLNTNVVNDSSGSSYSLAFGGRNDNYLYNINTIGSANNGNAFSAHLSSSHQYGNWAANYSHTNTSERFSSSARGGILLHKDGITFGQSLGETSGLIKAENAPNIEIANRTGIKTNSKGYAIIPSLQPYVDNKIILDLKNTGSNIDITNTINTIIPTKGAIVMSEFDTKIGTRALITFYKDKAPIPFGSIVVDEKKSSQFIVGEGGIAYITGLSNKEVFKVTLPNNSICFAYYDSPNADNDENVLVTDLECNTIG